MYWLVRSIKLTPNQFNLKHNLNYILNQQVNKLIFGRIIFKVRNNFWKLGFNKEKDSEFRIRGRNWSQDLTKCYFSTRSLFSSCYVVSRCTVKLYILNYLKMKWHILLRFLTAFFFNFILFLFEIIIFIFLDRFNVLI